jgi:hypothetical protein
MHIRLDESDLPDSGHDSFADLISPAWVEFDLDTWTVGLLFQSRSGRPVLTELRVYPTESHRRPGQRTQNVEGVPEGGLTPRVIKDLPVGRLRNQALQALTDPHHPAWENNWPNRWENWYDVAHYAGIDAGAEPDIPKRQGRPTLSKEQLALVASYYVEALAKGAKTTNHVSARLRQDGEHLSVGAVVGRIHKARVRGFLTEATKTGQKGGMLTAKAQEFLQTIATEGNDTDERKH